MWNALNIKLKVIIQKTMQRYCRTPTSQTPVIIKKNKLTMSSNQKIHSTNMPLILAFKVYVSLEIERVLILIHVFNNNFIKCLYLKSFVQQVLLSQLVSFCEKKFRYNFWVLWFQLESLVYSIKCLYRLEIKTQ